MRSEKITRKGGGAIGIGQINKKLGFFLEKKEKKNREIRGKKKFIINIFILLFWKLFISLSLYINIYTHVHKFIFLWKYRKYKNILHYFMM